MRLTLGKQLALGERVWPKKRSNVEFALEAGEIFAQGAPLDEIIKREFGEGISSSLNVSGCNIIANARAAHQFALIIHELATNAFKYGALSVPEGRISIAGDIEQTNGAALFSFLWTKRGGPQVTKPTRKGFGSVILLDAARQFGQRVVANYEPHGFTYELHVLMHDIEPSQASASIVPSNVAI